MKETLLIQEPQPLCRRPFGSIWKCRMQWFSWRTCTAGANVTADFSVVYTPWFLDMIRRSWFDHHDSTLITWRIPSQYVTGCKNNWEFCRGIRNSERKIWLESLALKDISVTKLESRQMRFTLKWKAVLPGKRRHDTEIMITCDTCSAIAEFECISVGDFIMDEILSIRRKAK